MIYWPMTGSDPSGKPVRGEPIVLPCRWEDKQQEILLPDKRKVLSMGYLLMAQALIPGSWVFLGGGLDPMADWQAMQGIYPQPPPNSKGGREVLKCNDTPDLKNQDHLFEVYL